MDKSWGASASPGFRVKANDGPGQRADTRAARSAERAEAMAGRQEARLARREADLQAAERARVERRENEQRLAAGDPHAAAAQRRRGSGRKDLVREQRDTSGYATVVDPTRLRALAKRGASLAGLAAVFGLSEEEVTLALEAGGSD